MGGTGSGRWNNYIPKRLIEKQTKINIHIWKRRKLLVNGSFYEWNLWEKIGLYWPVTVKVIGGTLEVTIPFQDQAGLQELVTNTIALGWTDNPLGGCRVWFVCPDCCRMVADLYLIGDFFLCRHCYKLGYESQRKLKE